MTAVACCQEVTLCAGEKPAADVYSPSRYFNTPVIVRDAAGSQSKTNGITFDVIYVKVFVSS